MSRLIYFLPYLKDLEKINFFLVSFLIAYVQNKISVQHIRTYFTKSWRFLHNYMYLQQMKYYEERCIKFRWPNRNMFVYCDPLPIALDELENFFFISRINFVLLKNQAISVSLECNPVNFFIYRIIITWEMNISYLYHGGAALAQFFLPRK